MTLRLSPLTGAVSLFVVLSLTATFASAGDGYTYNYYNPALIVPTPVLRRHACGKDHSVPNKRGVAILSPVESPDHCNPGVGGKPILVPYYPDFSRHPRHGPRVYVPGNGYGYFGPGAGFGESWVSIAGPADAGGYGPLTGANRDEEALLRLGGAGAAPHSELPNTAPDLLDMIHGGR